jgi:hypothetical protein
MKTTLKVIHTATALTLLTLAGCATSPHATRAWEYRVIEGWSRQPERAAFERQINEAGAQGYAVASSMMLPGDANNYPKTVVILKRPKP